MNDQLFALMISDPAGAASDVLQTETGTGAATVAGYLAALFDSQTIDRIGVRVGGTDYGVCDRAQFERLRSRIPRDLGDGDQARLPGAAVFTLVRFACDRCSQTRFLVHVDENNPPQCSDHGPMRVVS